MFALLFCLLTIATTRAEWLVNVQNTNYCVDVRHGALQAGKAVQLYECNGTPAQQWKPYPVYHPESAPALCMQPESLCNGAAVVLGASTQGGPPCLIAGSSGWDFTAYTYKRNDSAPDGWSPTAQRFCLDVRDGVFANGRSVQIWECDEFSTKNQNQLFKFQW